MHVLEASVTPAHAEFADNPGAAVPIIVSSLTAYFISTMGLS